MCTLTLVPQENGYYLAMNRDERIARGVGTPPQRIDLAGVGRFIRATSKVGYGSGLMREPGFRFAELE
jgi:hypothetical protein